MGIMFKPMLAKLTDIDDKKLKFPLYAQQKIDGIRCIGYFLNGVTHLQTRQGKEILCAPHIQEALHTLYTKHVHLQDTIFDGELDVPSLQNREDKFKLLRRTVNLHPHYESITYVVYDMATFSIHIAAKENTFMLYSEIQSQRIERLERLSMCFPANRCIHLLDTHCIMDSDKLNELYIKGLEQGWEGIITRPMYELYSPGKRRLCKHKPHDMDEFEIVGYTEEVSIYGEYKDTLGAFICKTPKGVQFKVGSGFTAEEREDFWKVKHNMIGKSIKVQYLRWTVKGSLDAPTFKGLV